MNANASNANKKMLMNVLNFVLASLNLIPSAFKKLREGYLVPQSIKNKKSTLGTQLYKKGNKFFNFKTPKKILSSPKRVDFYLQINLINPQIN